MSRVARFRVVAALDGAGGASAGTVEIDRDAGIFSVRPLRRRKLYSLPLATVATMVCAALVRAEIVRKRAEKKSRRPRRRRT